jgi:tol-pal system protein YbgF
MRLFLFFLLSLLFLAAREEALADDSMQQRLERAERDLATLQQMVYQGQPPSSTPATSSLPVSGDATQRLDDTQATLQQLTGQIEALSNRVAQLERLLPAEALSSATPAPSLSTPGAPIAGVVPGGGSVAPLPPTTNTPLPISGGAGGASFPAVGAADKPTPHAAYSQGYAQIQQGDYVGAEAVFKNFLNDYPADALAGNAQYWLGESYYARKDYTKAAEAFLTAYQKYPKNSKAADSLMKLGLSLSSLGNNDQACLTFSRLVKEYPGAAPATRERVGQERRKLACPSS